MPELPEVADGVFCCVLTSAMCLPGVFIVHWCLPLFAVSFAVLGVVRSVRRGDSASAVHGCPWLSSQWPLKRGLVH